MKGIERTVEEAREEAAANPKRWKAALVYETAAPMTRDATVRLYATIKGAEEDLRELSEYYKAEGYKRVFGTLGDGVLKFTRDGVPLVIFLEKRPK